MSTQYAFSYNHLDIAYRKMGRGKPLVMLHGWGTSGQVLLPLAEMLSDIRTCYVLDLPGFGHSPAPPHPWAIDDYADMVQSFAKSLDLNPVDLLVHSFGGRIALKLCAREWGKRAVDKVLITGGAGMKPKRSVKFHFKKYLAKTLKAPLLLLSGQAREKALQALRGTALWKWLGSSDYQKLSGVMRETFVKSVTEHLESCLPEIPHEVLLLWGRDDEATPLYQGERMEKGIENAALVTIEHAGHYAFLDRPKHFASITRAFLKGKSSSKR
ncbi:alpha/beta fold hydrolase [Halalkalibaculum sp. DA3122]|uniref:alpha/beta fold hydrolase n=1 Tax=unclassified Halalkalibaculum TaxID=2964617 RepID=UPI003755155F